jgi:hypothetical protein
VKKQSVGSLLSIKIKKAAQQARPLILCPAILCPAEFRKLDALSEIRN